MADDHFRPGEERSDEAGEDGARSPQLLGVARNDGAALPRTAPRYELIELMFFAYRDFVEDADRMLAVDGFGRAHHRVLYFAVRRPGLTIAELLDTLKITKQSLNRVLRDLIERGFVTSRLGDADRRQRRLHATPRGIALVEQIAEVQSARFDRAFARLARGAEGDAAAFLGAMVEDDNMAGDLPSREIASEVAP